MLNENGCVIIDDVQLHSIKELARLIYADKERFDLVSDLGKALIFKKKTDEKFLPEWADEPYLKSQTDVYISSSEPNSLGKIKPISFVKKLKRKIRKIVKLL
jgi:hypothetical protein